jgi:large subunit ribosomal protein L11
MSGGVVLNRTVRLLVGAGAAKPGPAIGQALGPLGVNMAEFCKQFNDRTKTLEKDTPTPVVLSAFSNRSFTFVTKTPPTSWFLKKCAGVQKGSGKARHDIVGKVHVKQIYEIAKVKQRDPHLQKLSLQALCKCIAGSAGSMGIEVVRD